MIFAISAPVLVGAAALMAETGYEFWRHNHLQAVADAAAYAAAIEQSSGSSESKITEAARNAALANGWKEAEGDIEVNTPPTSGSYISTKAVEVKISETQPRFFTALFVKEPLVTKARAVAATDASSNACVLALNPKEEKAIEVQGSADVQLGGCDVVANSVDDEALFVWGSSKLKASCISSAGGIVEKNNITVVDCPAPITRGRRASDPYSQIEKPTPGQSQPDPPNNPKGTTYLKPGAYSNGMDLKGDVVLEPGTYYISGGDFKVNANAKISGDGVTIYLESGSNVHMNGNATVKLTAPTSGDYTGILFFGDREGEGEHVFNGNAGSKMEGDLYFPKQKVSYSGSVVGNGGGCTRIIADMVEWTGDADFDVDCSKSNAPPIVSQTLVRIVE